MSNLPNKNLDVSSPNLTSAGQMQMRQLVHELPEECVSMTWRSNLNEQLLQSAALKTKKRWWSSSWRPAFGLALAAALVGVMFVKSNRMNPNIVAAPSSISASQLVSDHLESVQYIDATDGVLETSEPMAISKSVRNGVSSPSNDWTELDVENL